MSQATLKQDIDAMYKLADQCRTLTQLVPALCEVLKRHEQELSGVSYSYRLHATDTGFCGAFRLEKGRFTQLTDSEPMDVTISGSEANLLAVFQRKLNPAAALLFRKIKVNGSMAALTKMADFL